MARFSLFSALLAVAALVPLASAGEIPDKFKMVSGNGIGTARILGSESQYSDLPVTVNKMEEGIYGEFRAEPFGDGSKIYNYGCQRYLTIIGSNVYGTDKPDPDYSKWYFEPNDDGSYIIKSPQGLVMTAFQESGSEEGLIYTIYADHMNNQKWTLESIPSSDSTKA
ncbi:hypothetical protein DFQ27_003587 [Actinomortierella ambigua]|uniref:Ricin B lectin domain-containing protein n=1 Tax=Actinomortierella ambigua TaxID=1343610 RepID=A0A9P6Q647_9FUNG|nr:hypothetical protein DFQ27_003587 [Actinomortierella ambigua]